MFKILKIKLLLKNIHVIHFYILHYNNDFHLIVQMSDYFIIICTTQI